MTTVGDKYHRIRLTGWALFFLFLLLLRPSFSQSALRIGATLPSIKIYDVSGRLVKVPDHFKGKTILLHFWRIGCTSCRSTLPSLNEFYSRYRNKGLEIIAINVGQDEKTVKSFAEKLKAEYIMLVDNEKKSESLYDVIDLPRTYLIDRRGVVRYRIIGDATPEMLHKLILSLI